MKLTNLLNNETEKWNNMKLSLLYSPICRFTSTYMHIYTLNNSQQHNDKDARRNKRRTKDKNAGTIKMHEGRCRKTSLTTHLPLTLFVRFEKGCSRVFM